MTDKHSSKPDPIASLRRPSFLLYVVGSLLSNTGNQMRLTVANWDVWEITHSKLHVGYVGLVLALPVLLFALPAGAAADRYSRRGMIMLGQAGLALSGLGLAWAAWTSASLWLYYLFLFGTGAFRALGWPAATAIVADLVPPRVFSNAAMWRSVSWQLAATLGPLAGALVLAYFGSALVYIVDAVSSVILMVCMLFVRTSPHKRVAEPKSWRSLIEGIHYLRRQPVLLSTMWLDMVAVLFGGATALLSIYATEVLGVGAFGYGWLRAMQPLGAIFMGLLLAVLPPIRHGGKTLLWAVVAFGVATIVFGLSKSYPLSLAALFLAGAADNISVVIRATVLQLLTPNSMRGRVSAVSVIFIGTSNEIGEFESGLAAEWLGLVPAVTLGGVMTLVTVGVVARVWPELRRLGSLEHLQPPEPTNIVE
ncbi:MAG: MFS transporter [Pirellulales bacterium]